MTASLPPPTQQESKGWSPVSLLAVGLLVVVGIGIARSQTRTSDLWFDEVYSVSESLLPTRQIWPIVLREGGNMWGYIMLLRPLQLVTRREIVYEAPSIVFGLWATVNQFRLLASRTTTLVATLFAGAFLAVLSISQLTEVRSYTLAVLVVQTMMLLFVRRSTTRRANAMTFAVLLFGPMVHLLLAFPAGILAMSVLWDAWRSPKTGRVRRAWPVLGVVISGCLVVWVNVANPVGSSQLDWLKAATPDQSVSQLLKIFDLSVPGPSTRIAFLGLVVAVGLAAIGAAVDKGSEKWRFAFFAGLISVLIASAGVVSNGFLSLPDRYGLLLLPGANATFGLFSYAGWKSLAGRRQAVHRVAGVVLLGLMSIAVADRLNSMRGYSQVQASRAESRRGSAAFRLLSKDLSDPRSSETIYAISPGVRLELAVWLRLHGDRPAVAALERRLPPFDVHRLAEDSPQITQGWMADAATAANTRRVVVVDYQTGCHLPAAALVATQLGGTLGPVDAFAGYALQSVELPQGAKPVRVMNNNCGILLR